MTLNPYLTFNGNCQEAMEFYKDCLGGKFLMKHTVGEMQPKAPEEVKGLIMHLAFEFDGNTIMAADTQPGQEVVVGSNIAMSINMDDAEKMGEIFKNLSAGGRVAMPLEKTFWGAIFGMFIDKYGISWMFNCEVKKPK